MKYIMHFLNLILDWNDILLILYLTSIIAAIIACISQTSIRTDTGNSFKFGRPEYVLRKSKSSKASSIDNF